MMAGGGMINKVIGYTLLSIGLFSCLVFVLSGVGSLNIPYLQTTFSLLFSNKGDNSVIFVVAMSAIGAYLVKG
jgi:hypothetical protein